LRGKKVTTGKESEARWASTDDWEKLMQWPSGAPDLGREMIIVVIAGKRRKGTVTTLALAPKG
jgi:hypothetical protein